MDDLNNDGPPQVFIRRATNETPIVRTIVPLPPAPEPASAPIMEPYTPTLAPLPGLPVPVYEPRPVRIEPRDVVIGTSSVNLAPDISTYPSTNEPYFQLANNNPAPSDPSTWYLYPSQSGSVLIDNTFPPGLILPSPGTLHAFDQTITYQNQSLMPSTWYLNPSLNGEISLVDASGTQVLQSISGNLFYNNELLAKANDLQDIADWSYYPALNPAGVDMDGHALFNASDISGASAHIGALTAGSITSNGIINAASHQIQNATAVTIGPSAVGTLTSADGVALTWNGDAITTGSGGDVSQWSSFPALTSINANGQVINNITTLNGITGSAINISSDLGQSLNLNAQSNATMTSTAGNVSITSTNGTITESTPNGSINRTAYNSINDECGTSYNLTVDRFLTPLGAPLNITAQNGLGGNIQITAKQSATIPGQGSIGYGEIGISALGSSNPGFGLGGKIDITAYSGGVGEYGGSTSRVSVGAATVALSAGAAPALPGLAGSMNIFGNGAVSIVADLVPPVLPQIPETVYIFGRGAIRMETGSAFGVDGGVQSLSDFYAGNIYPISDSDLVLQGRSAPDGYVKIMDCNQFEMTGGTIAKIDTIQVAAGGTTNPVTIDNLTGNVLSADTTNLTITGKNNLVGTDYYVNVSMADTIAFDAGGAGALTGVQTINGSAYPPAPGDASQWSTFKALQAVDMSGNGLTNLTSINGVPYVASNTDQWATYFAVSNVDMSGADITNVVNISGKTGTGDVQLFSYDTMGVSSVNDLTVESQSAVLQLAGNTDVNIDSAVGGINLASTTQVIVETSVLNMNNNKITNVSPGTTTTDGVNFNQLTFRDSTEFFVSAQGTDGNNGSFLSPFRTIQAAITAAELISSAALVCVINVASGHYVENLTFNKGYVILNGSLQSQTGNEVCEITGSISIACVGANDVFNRQVTFQGFNITTGAAQSVVDTSTSSHTVSFQDCKMFTDSVFFNSTSTAADMRFYLTNVELSQTNAAFTGALVTTNLGLCEFERLDVNLVGNCTGLAIGGTSVLSRCSLSTFDANNAAAILRPLITITSSTTAAHSLGNVAFSFTNAAAKTNTSAVYINSGINTALIALNCVFTLAGTANSTNFCVGYSGVGSPTLVGVNNTSLSVNVLLPQTTAVQSGITQIQYINIDPPVLGTYSSSIDQTIAVGSTPQALTFNTSQNYHGTALVAGSRVYVGSQGNYQINYQCQLQNTSGLSIFAQTFLKKNGALVANSTSNSTITTTTAFLHQSPQIIVQMNSGDYIEVWMNGPVTLSANAAAASGTVPAAQSVLLNIAQIR